jgi:hypothetical protein
MRRYSPKSRRSTPQYGTYPPSNPTPDHDASVLVLALNHDLPSPSQLSTPSFESTLEISPVFMENPLVASSSAATSSSSAATSPSVSVSLPASVPATVATAIEICQTDNLSTGEFINDVNNNGLATVHYRPAITSSSKRRGFYGIPAFASAAMPEEQGVVARRIRTAPVKHQRIQHEPTLNISAFISPQPEEFDSVFKTFISDVDSNGNRLSALLDQFLDETPLLDSAAVIGMNSRFGRQAYNSDLNSLIKAVTGDCLDDHVLEPREVQKGPSFTLMEKCMTISISVPTQ